MRHVDKDPAVRSLAARLGIAGERGLAPAIRDVVIAGFQEEMCSCGVVPRTLDEVLEAVAALRGMEFVHVANDTDIAKIAARYESELPGLDRQLSFEFGDSTEAIVMRRPRTDPRAGNRYLAVVDARGHRANKAWYGDRHEAVHILLPDASNEQMFRRTSADRPEPFEQVVDHIASKLGFWPPLITGPLQAALHAERDVLAAFERARQEVAPNASREAAFRAFAEYVPEPLLVFWSDLRRRKRGGLDTLALRVQTVIVNEAARSVGLFVPHNYRIPDHSVITIAHSQPWECPYSSADNLGQWRDSSGRALPPLPVHVVARGRWGTLRLAR